MARCPQLPLPLPCLHTLLQAPLLRPQALDLVVVVAVLVGVQVLALVSPLRWGTALKVGYKTRAPAWPHKKKMVICLPPLLMVVMLVMMMAAAAPQAALP